MRVVVVCDPLEINKRAKKPLELVTGRLEVAAFFSQPVNLVLNPADTHLNTYLSPLPPTNTRPSDLQPINLCLSFNPP